MSGTFSCRFRRVLGFFVLKRFLTPFLLLVAGTVHGELTFEPSWELPGYDKVRGQALAWIDEVSVDADMQVQARSLWPSVDLRNADGTALLDRLADTFAVLDARAQALVTACNAQHSGPLPPEAAWLDDPSLSKLLRDNLRLYYARWLAEHGFYDEVLATLEGLQAADVVDPAGLLFYRMVAYQQLVQPEQSRAALVQLLEHEQELPQRYQKIAQLVRRDLANLKDESLDHIARRMNDVRRRLDIGRAGERVQTVERGVVESLDQLIKKLEEQQQQQQAAASASGSAQNSKPMQDSRLPAMKAPGRVDQRDIGSQSGWGDLPPKEREQALQQIGREFPAHYRELIEQYFRDLADQNHATPSK